MTRQQPKAAGAGRALRHGRIRQSLVLWCLEDTEWGWDLERVCGLARDLGCPSVELVPPEKWATLREQGLECALAANGMPDPPFARGLNNPAHHAEIVARTSETIDQCAAFGVPNVIAFTGYKWRDPTDPTSGEIPLAEGADNCVTGLKALAEIAEAKGVIVCLEHLNTRDDSHPMKGHPGYQGDDLDYCADIVRRVGSPNVKLLFDVYHVQVMNGDVIRRLRQHRDLLGHVHVAGAPGRGELDDTQEVHYPAVMKALLDVGYTGYVGLEFIPTRDPSRGLAEAVALCDV
jgi:sugar phosphate isomerase/epimerase